MSLKKEQPAVYFDNAAAAPPDDGALELLLDAFRTAYANQEAAHGMAYLERKDLDAAAESIAAALTGGSAHVFWATTGTEAINAAVNSLSIPDGAKIVTTKAEHASLSAALGRKNARLEFAPVTSQGLVDFDSLESILDKDTSLVALHHVQPETGALQDLPRIRKVMDRLSPKALFMSDTIQSACKLPLPWAEARLDFAFVAGRKTGAPGGALVLCRHKSSFDRLREQRSKLHLTGRIEPAVALALADVVRKKCAAMPGSLPRVRELNSFLRAGLEAFKCPRNGGIDFTVPIESSSPHILHFRMRKVQSAIIVRALSEMGVITAAGSACESESGTPSQTLTAMGFKKDEAYSGLRLSFNDKNTIAEAERFLSALKDALASY